MAVMRSVVRRAIIIGVADGNAVVARGSEGSLVHSTGRRYHMRFVHWLTFDDAGKIISMREFNDTAEMAKAFDA